MYPTAAGHSFRHERCCTLSLPHLKRNNTKPRTRSARAGAARAGAAPPMPATPLDDLLSETQRFINLKASRSGVSRLLRREGMAKLADFTQRAWAGQARFASAAELESTLMNYQNTYNHHIPQRALNHLSPIEAPQDGSRKSPELFVKRVYKQTELDKHRPPTDSSQSS